MTEQLDLTRLMVSWDCNSFHGETMVNTKTQANQGSKMPGREPETENGECSPPDDCAAITASRHNVDNKSIQPGGQGVRSPQRWKLSLTQIGLLFLTNASDVDGWTGGLTPCNMEWTSPFLVVSATPSGSPPASYCKGSA